MLEHLELIEKHLDRVRMIVIASTVIMFTLCAVISTIFVLALADAKGAYERATARQDLLSARLDRNYDAIKDIKKNCDDRTGQ